MLFGRNALFLHPCDCRPAKSPCVHRKAMPSSPTVLHVAQPTTAGVPRVVTDLARDQVRRGWRVLVACPDEGDLAVSAVAVGAEQLSWPARRAPGPGVPGETRRLASLCRRVGPDLVHLHSSKAGLAGRLALRGRLPTVFQPHAWSFLAVEGPVRTASLAWERHAARWCHALAVVSEGERQLGRDAGIVAPYVIARNGVDLAQRRPAGPQERALARAELSLPDAPIAVCVGRLSRQKGQDLLLAAWPSVRRAVPDAHLVLVGDGPDRSVLQSRAGTGVQLVGSTSDPDRYMQAADIVVLPSRWEAGLSLAAMEAMALGRCVVAADVAGTAEGLAPGGGVVVPIDDLQALTGAVTACLLDRTGTDDRGRLGRRTVERDYDLTRTSAATAELYEGLWAR